MSEQQQHEGRTTHLQRGVLFTSVGAGVNIVFLMMEAIIAARLVSTSNYGIYTLLVALVNFLVVAVDFGCKTAAAQMLASSPRDRQAVIVANTLLFRLAVILVVSVLIWLLEQPLIAFDSTPGLVLYIGYLPFMLVVTSLDELLFGILQGFHCYRQIAIAMVMRSVLRLGLTVVLLAGFDLGVLALVYSWTISFAASSLYQYLVLPTGRRLGYQRALLVEMLRFGFPLQMARVLWFAFRRVDVLLLGTFAGPASVAFYAVASRIPDALQRMADSYTTVYFPTMTALLKSDQHIQARWVFNRSLRLVSFAAALMALGGVVFNRQIVLLLFSERYLPSAPVFAVLMLAFHMTLVVSLLGYTLTAAGFPGRSLTENTVRTTLNIIGDLVLIPLYGFMGPAAASLVTAYIGNPVVVWLLRRTGHAVEVRPYAIQSGTLLLCAWLFWLVQGGMLFGSTILVIFVVLNILLSTITWEDLYLVLPERMRGQPAVVQETPTHGS